MNSTVPKILRSACRRLLRSDESYYPDSGRSAERGSFVSLCLLPTLISYFLQEIYVQGSYVAFMGYYESLVLSLIAMLYICRNQYSDQ
jgi:hypothetical protein